MADFELTVAKLRAVFELDSAQWESGIRKVQDSAKAWQKDLNSIGLQAVDIGKDFTAAFTVPIVAAFGAAAKAAIDFESSFAGVRKTVEATEPEFEAMAAQLRELATIIPVNVNDLNRLAEAAGALGIPKEEIVDFTRVMAELGVTTNLTADQAAESIAKIQNIFGAAGVATENFASALVALGNNGASTESQILEMATRIAAAGNTIGLTQAEVLGFANTLASLGLEAEAGGTAISRVFVNISAAVSKGGQDLQAFASVAQMTSESFASMFKSDPAEALVAFVEGLSRVKESGGDVIKVLADLGVEEVRLRDTLLRLAGAGDMLRESLALSNAEWDKASALSNEAQERFKTTEAQLTLLWNRLKDVAITFGNALLPMIQSAVQALNAFLPILQGAAELFGELPGPMQAMVVGFGLLVAAIGPALIVFGQMSLGAASLAGAFSSAGIATKLLALELPLLGTSLGGAAASAAALLGPIGLLAAAIGAIVIPVALYQLPKLLDDVAQSYEPVKRTLVEGSEAAKIAAANTQELAVNLDAGTKQAGLSKQALDGLFDTVEKASGGIKKQADVTAVLTEEQKKYNEAVQELVDGQIIDAVTAGLQEGTEWLERQKTASERAVDEWVRYGATIESIPLLLSDVAVSGEAAMNALPFIGERIDLTPLFEYTDATEALGALWGELAKIELDKIRQQAAELRDLGDAFRFLGSTLEGSAGQLASGIGQVIQAFADFDEASKKAAVDGEQIKVNFTTLATGIVDGISAIVAATDGGGSTAMNTLNGAIAGLSAGMNPALIAATGGWSAAIGAAAGALVGLARSAGETNEALEKHKQAVALARDFTADLADTFRDSASAFELIRVGADTSSLAAAELDKVLEDLGDPRTGESILIALEQAVKRGPEAVQQMLDMLNAKMEEHRRIMENWAAGVATYTEGLTLRIDGFAQSMAGVTEATEKTQATFDELTGFVTNAFVVMLVQSGSAIEALAAIQGPLNQLIELQEQLGLQGSETFQRLADVSAVINANKDIFDSIAGLQMMMEGLAQATILTSADMQAFGRDAAALFAELTARGVDANMAMALMQPTLQALWEHQQKFHDITDEATLALLAQAEAAGIVGEQQKSINQQILDAILGVKAAIDGVTDAILRMPQAFAQATAAANELADAVGRVMDEDSVPTGNVAVPRVSHQGSYVFHKGGVLTAHRGLMVPALQPDERLIKALTGEAVLNRQATSLFGPTGIAALNAGDPWGAVQRMASLTMPASVNAGMSTTNVSHGGATTVGAVNIYLQGTGNSEQDGKLIARAFIRELETGGQTASDWRRVHQQIVVS